MRERDDDDDDDDDDGLMRDDGWRRRWVSFMKITKELDR